MDPNALHVEHSDSHVKVAVPKPWLQIVAQIALAALKIWLGSSGAVTPDNPPPPAV